MKLKKILGFLFLLVVSFTLKAQVVQADRAYIRKNFQPPQDTLIDPVKLGELRSRTADTSVYISISLTGKKWSKIAGGGIGGLADGNNYVNSINYNSGTGIFTLSRVGLPSLTTSIIIPTYNGSETKIQAGTGGISLTGIGTTGNPYVISGTLDGNNYLTSGSYSGGLLTLNRQGLTPVTVSIPESQNNYPTALNYSNGTLSLSRNGLSDLSTSIPVSANNFPTSVTYVGSTLTINRSGLTPITTTIPAIDTNILATRAWRKKGDDSLGVLTKNRYFKSSDNSIGFSYSAGPFGDTVNVTNLAAIQKLYFRSSSATIDVDTIDGPVVDTINLEVNVGPPSIDTNILSTRLWRQKGDDSLGALTKTRYFFSSNNSISVVKKLGALQDSIDITSLDTAVSILMLSGDGSVNIDYKQGATEDTFDIRIPTPGASVGDNWGTQFAWTDATLQGNGLVATPLRIDTASLFFTANKVRTFARDSIPTLYSQDGSTGTGTRIVSITSLFFRDLSTSTSRLTLTPSLSSLRSPDGSTSLQVSNSTLNWTQSNQGANTQILSGNLGDSTAYLRFVTNSTNNGTPLQNSIYLQKDYIYLNSADSVAIGYVEPTGILNSGKKISYASKIPITTNVQLTPKWYVDSVDNLKQNNILFQDEGINLGTTGTVNLINFTGAGVTTSRSGNTVTVNIPNSGVGGGLGTVTSVGLTMPAAFSVSGSPITTSGTLAVTALGNSGQYITGAGTLQTFPTIPTYDGSETKVQAGSNIIVSGLGTIGSPYVVSGNAGTVTSVGLTAPPAFTTSGPVTGSGNLELIAAGNSSQYIRGDGLLATFPVIPTYDGSETKVQAGTNITVTGLGTNASPYIINASGVGAGVSSVGLTAFSGINVSNSPITSSGNIALSTTLNGMLYGTGSGFATASISSPLSFSGGTLSMTQAGAGSNGWLSSTNWNTFNNKQEQFRTMDEGNTQGAFGTVNSLNFVGAGVTASHSSGITTVTIPGATADGTVYAEKQFLTPTWLTLYDNTTARVMNSVFKAGHLTDNEYRTITINAGYHLLRSSYAGGYVTVATLPSGFIPNNVIHFPIAEYGFGDEYENFNGFAFYDRWEYKHSSGRILPTGEVQINVVLDGTNNYSKSAQDNQEHIIVPIHVTFFLQSFTGGPK